MRTFYTVLFYLLIPFIVARLLWRSLSLPDYRRRWGERFGIYKGHAPQGVVWFHAVSVGEVEALFPLIRVFQKESQNIKLLITTTTPTGSARVKSVLKNSVEHVYLPYDVPFALKRFFHRFNPVLAVIVETEIWPNLYGYCGAHNIPLYLVNARLSKKSTKGYRLIPGLIRPALNNLTGVAAQTVEDAQRFTEIGVNRDRLFVPGNVKFDIDISQQIIEEGERFKADSFPERFVWVAGSTHDGEEQLCLDVYRAIKPNIPELLLVLVPRHPERFRDVERLCKKYDVHIVKRTENAHCDTSTDVYLADTMGELKLLYAAADVAFVGGSLVNVGGHNVLEAVAVGVPVLFGPYMANFKEIAFQMTDHDAALPCQDQEELASGLARLYSDPSSRIRLIENAKLFLQKNRGATSLIYHRLSQVLANAKRYD